MKRIVTLTLLVFLAKFYGNAQKTVWKPAEWSRAGTDFYGRLNDTRSYQTANFVIFWGDAVGNDPTTASPADRRFNPKGVCDTLEFIYKRFIGELKFCSDAPTTNLGKYKIIIVMLGTFGANGPQGFAYGGTYEGVIGAMWVDPNAVKDGGALSHELTHTLQGMISIQENKVGGGFNSSDATGFIWEGHANYMRSLVYQKMADTDIPRWMATRNYHWSSTRHHYANFHLLMYIQEADGFDMTRRIWAESKANEHPLQTLARLKGFNQSQLNDYLWNYAKKQATFDIPIDKNSNVNPSNSFGSVIRGVVNNFKNQQPRYMWKQYTLLKQVAGSTDRYVVPDEWAPQDYGMNVIPLHTTCTGASKVVTVKFKGHTEVNPNYASWRYGFVTAKSDGTISRYSPMYSANEAEISFDQQANETQMFLVVYGAPKIHTSYVWEPGFPKIKRYPYEVKIANAVPEGYQADDSFRSYLRTNGKKHTNGGGWVTNGTTIASTVYVGPKAIVRGGNYSGNVRIEGTAQVYNATMSGNVIIRGNACINGGTFSENAIVEENAFMEACTMKGTALSTDNVFVFGVNYSGNVIMGGDSENGDCAAGVYLQFPHGNNGRNSCDGKGASDASNQDVNPAYTLFTDAQMNFAATPSCSATVTDMEDIQVENTELVVYPNPSQHGFKLASNSLMNIYSMKLYNAQGMKVFEKSDIEASLVEFGANLEEGTYLLKLQYASGKTAEFKLLKTR